MPVEKTIGEKILGEKMTDMSQRTKDMSGLSSAVERLESNRNTSISEPETTEELIGHLAGADSSLEKPVGQEK